MRMLKLQAYIVRDISGSFCLPFPLECIYAQKRLRPVMQVGALLTPIFGLLLILSLDTSSELIQRACFMCWGMSFLLFHVPGMPRMHFENCKG